MTNYQEELKALKERLGNHEPSLLLKAREELITIKKSLAPLFKEQLSVSQLVEKLITQQEDLAQQLQEIKAEHDELMTNSENLLTEKETLQDQLDQKRLESLQEFSKYQEKIKELQDTELQELANLRQQVSTCQKEKQGLEQRISYLRKELTYSHSNDPNQSAILFFFTLILLTSLLNYPNTKSKN